MGCCLCICLVNREHAYSFFVRSVSVELPFFSAFVLCIILGALTAAEVIDTVVEEKEEGDEEEEEPITAFSLPSMIVLRAVLPSILDLVVSNCDSACDSFQVTSC